MSIIKNLLSWPSRLLGKTQPNNSSEPQVSEPSTGTNAVAFVNNGSELEILLSIDKNASDEFIISYLLAVVKEELYDQTFSILIKLRPSSARLIEKVLEELNGPLIPADKANLL